MDKRFWAIVAIIVVFFVGFLVINNKEDAAAPAGDGKPTNHVKGSGAITLLEYGDFQCPACAQYYPVVEEVVDKYSSDITFQFRHFPLVSIHQNAFAASRAAEAASKQGKFWDMYNKLYSGQNDWAASENPTGIFDLYADQIDLDKTKYKEDFASSVINDAINADLAAGKKLDITGTPAFVLNGKKIENPSPSVEAFSKIIDKAIAEQKSTEQ